MSPHDPTQSPDLVARHEAQIADTARQTQINAVALARINGSMDTLALRVGGLADRVGEVGRGLSDVRADLRLQAETHRDTIGELREAVQANGQRLEQYLQECREYRLRRHHADVERDRAQGLAVHEPAPPDDGEDSSTSTSILASVAYSLRQPWFWATLLGLVVGVGGVEAIGWLARLAGVVGP